MIHIDTVYVHKAMSQGFIFAAFCRASDIYVHSEDWGSYNNRETTLANKLKQIPNIWSNPGHLSLKVYTDEGPVLD